MPFTRISMIAGKSSGYRRAIVDGIYMSLRETFAVAEGDRFMVVHQYDKEDFVYHDSYLGMQRSADAIVIEITCNNTRSTEQKKALYRDLVSKLERSPGVRPDDVIICIVEVAKENWSMGKGMASFA